MNPSYILKIYRDVEKQLLRIPKNHRKRLINTMRSLRDNARPPGCKKLDDVLYRVRQGQYRIIYAIFDSVVLIVICKVVKRAEDTYKNLQILLDRAENLLDQE